MKFSNEVFAIVNLINSCAVFSSLISIDSSVTSLFISSGSSTLLFVCAVVEVVVIPFDISSITSGSNSVVSKLGIKKEYAKPPIAKIIINNNRYLF